jgi:hypothetical protein
MTKLPLPLCNLQAAIYQVERMRTSNQLHIPLDQVVPTLNHFHYNALQVGLHELAFHSFQPRYQPPDRPKKTLRQANTSLEQLFEPLKVESSPKCPHQNEYGLRCAPLS